MARRDGLVIARHLLVTRLDTGVLVGHALLCPDARYATVRWKGADRLDRRFGAPAAWRSVDADLSIGWEKGLVASGSATSGLLVRDEQRGVVALQKFTKIPIDEDGSGAAAACDGYLHVQDWT